MGTNSKILHDQWANRPEDQRSIVDDRNYTVVGINGYRQGCLTKDQAMSHARQMQEQMDRAGWSGRMRIYYRDGSLVATLGETK